MIVIQTYYIRHVVVSIMRPTSISGVTSLPFTNALWPHGTVHTLSIVNSDILLLLNTVFFFFRFFLPIVEKHAISDAAIVLMNGGLNNAFKVHLLCPFLQDVILVSGVPRMYL